MFGFLKKAFDSTVGKLVNSAVSPFSGILKQLGLDKVIGPLAAIAAKVPGLNMTFGAALAVLPELINGKFDLTDAIKLGAAFAPPPAGAIASMVDLDNVTGSILNITGAVDPNSAEGKNLLAFAQQAAFSLAGNA